MPALTYPHIEFRADGMPMIAGTPIKVVEIVLDRLAYHWDAEEIQRQHPRLTLGQIYGALSYYYDHEEELNRLIEQRNERADEIFARLGSSPLRAKLLAARKR